MRTREQFIQLVDAYQARTGLTDRQLGVAAANDKRLLQRLRSGVGVTLTLIEKLEAYMGGDREDAA